MLSSPGWPGSTWTTGPSGTLMPRPAWAITGSTPACPTRRRRPWRVDGAMMADSVARRVFEIDELREHTWNPLLANPGKAIYQLLARGFAPLPERLGSVAGRLAEVPAALAGARRQLGRMPRVHLETAIGQFGGTIALVSNLIDAALEVAPQSAAGLAQVRPAALEALTEHRT